MLADANGLQGDDALVAGSSLTVPEVKTSSNDASTFKPYNPSEITGPTTPSLPYIAPPDKGCGTIGMILMVAVAVIVSVVTYGAASTAMGGWIAGGLAGAASSAASQIVGNITGNLDGFSFKDIAIGAIGGAITGGVTSAMKGGAEGLKAATRFADLGKNGAAQLTTLGRVTSGLVSYGANVVANKVMGRETNFSWKGVAASAVGSYAAAKLGGSLSSLQGGDASQGFWKDVGGGLVTGATTATVDRMFGLGKQDWARIAADAFGNALGNKIAMSMAEAKAPARKLLSPDELNNWRGPPEEANPWADMSPGGSTRPLVVLVIRWRQCR